MKSSYSQPLVAVPAGHCSGADANQRYGGLPRDAAWLVKRHAVTVLPSVASLDALRVFARKGQGTKGCSRPKRWLAPRARNGSAEHYEARFAAAITRARRSSSIGFQ